MNAAEGCRDPDWDMLACGGKKREAQGASSAARRRRTSDISFLSMSEASDADEIEGELRGGGLRKCRRCVLLALAVQGMRCLPACLPGYCIFSQISDGESAHSSADDGACCQF